MILNSESAELVRQNATRLAQCVGSKSDLAELATAGTYEQVIFAVESLLTHTEMYFDDEYLAQLDDDNWRSFKSVLLVYTLNVVNRSLWTGGGLVNSPRMEHHPTPQ
jgi:hypothetical protein